MISYGVGVLCDGQPIRRSGASIRERALRVELLPIYFSYSVCSADSHKRVRNVGQCLPGDGDQSFVVRVESDPERRPRVSVRACVAKITSC